MSARHTSLIIEKRAVKIEAQDVMNEESYNTYHVPKKDFNTPAQHFDSSVIDCVFKIKQEKIFNHVQDLNDACQNSDEFNTEAVRSNNRSVKRQCKQVKTSADETHPPIAALSAVQKTTIVPNSVATIKLEKEDTIISGEAEFNSNSCNLPSGKLESEELEVNYGSPTMEASNSDLTSPRSERSAFKQNAEKNSSESFQRTNSVKCNDDAIYSCIFCKQSFETKLTLLSHLSFHYSERPYRCAHCEYAFKSKMGLVAHLPVHWNKKQYTCSMCNKSFRRSSSLLLHRLRHSKTKPRKPHVCTVCGKKFLVKIDLTSHLASQCAERPYACSLCKKTFKTKHTFLRHRLCHTNKRPFTCNICGKSFKARPHLKEHYESHSDERPHRCDSCGMEFKNKSVLDNHVQRVHIKIRHFFCTVCDKSFVKRYELTRHMQLHTDEKSFFCSHCNKAFRTQRNLMGHLSRATAKKSFQCKNCGKGHKTKQELASHIKHKSCSVEQLYSCNHCAKVFRKEAHLKAHFSKFSQRDHQTCHHCKRTFATEKFKRHLLFTFSRMHFFCKNCKIDFKTKQSFVQHLAHYQDVNLQTCNHCDKLFETKHKLEQHLLHNHLRKNLLCPSNHSTFGGARATGEMPMDDADRRFRGRTYTRVPRHKRMETSFDKNHLPEGDSDGSLLFLSNQSMLGSTPTTGEISTSSPRSTELIVKMNTEQESQCSMVHILKTSTLSDDTDQKFRGRTYCRVPSRVVKASADKNQLPETRFTTQMVPSSSISGNTEIPLEMAVEEG